MPEPLKEPKVRIQLDLSASQADRFDKLMRDCELSSRKELFNVAMSLFYWATQEAGKGRKIASYDEGTNHVETILIPALENVSLRAADSSSLSTADAVPRRAERPAVGTVQDGGNLVASS